MRIARRRSKPVPWLDRHSARTAIQATTAPARMPCALPRTGSAEPVSGFAGCHRLRRTWIVCYALWRCADRVAPAEQSVCGLFPRLGAFGWLVTRLVVRPRWDRIDAKFLKSVRQRLEAGGEYKPAHVVSVTAAGHGLTTSVAFIQGWTVQW